MKKFFLLLICIFSSLAFGQDLDTPIRYVGSILPSTCTVGENQTALVFKTGNGRGVYYCASTDNYQSITGSGNADLSYPNADLLSDYSGDLAAAIRAIGATETVLFVNQQSTLNANVVVPANVLLKLSKGVKIKVPNPYTLTFEGQGIDEAALTGEEVVFDIPTPLPYRFKANYTAGDTTLTFSTGGYSFVASRDVGRFIYFPNLNFVTRITAVISTTQIEIADPIPPGNTSFTDADLTDIEKTWTDANVDFTDDGSLDASEGNVLTDNTMRSITHTLQTGDKIQVSGTLAGGLSAATNYYAIRVNGNYLAFATSYANAFAGTRIDLTSAGSGTQTVRFIWDSVYYEDHPFKTGEKVQLTTTGALPSGLATGTAYYIIKEGKDHIKFALTHADAYEDRFIDLSEAFGGGTHTITATPFSYSNKHALVYNVAWTGTKHAKRIATTIFDDTDYFTNSGYSRFDEGLTALISAASCALAEKPATIEVHPTEPLNLYAYFTSQHVYEFQAGDFYNTAHTSAGGVQTSIEYTGYFFSNVRITGKGRGLTRIYESPVVGSQAILNGGQSDNQDGEIISNVEIDNITFLGAPKPPQTYNQNYGTINTGNIRHFYFHNNEMINMLGFGVSAGVGWDMAADSATSDHIEITNNYFRRFRTQVIAIISGNNFKVNHNVIDLQRPAISYAISAIDIEPNSPLANIDSASNGEVVGNKIDVRGSYGTNNVTGISLQGVEYYGFRNVIVRDNQIIGADIPAAAPMAGVSNTFGTGINATQMIGGVISDNYIQNAGGGQNGIYIAKSSFLFIQGNKLSGMGSTARSVTLDNVIGSVLDGNLIINPTGHANINTISELNSTGLLSADGSGTITRWSGTGGAWGQWLVSGRITISGVDYTVATVPLSSSATTTAPSPASTVTTVPGAVMTSANAYVDVPNGSLTAGSHANWVFQSSGATSRFVTSVGANDSGGAGLQRVVLTSGSAGINATQTATFTETFSYTLWSGGNLLKNNGGFTYNLPTGSTTKVLDAFNNSPRYTWPSFRAGNLDATGTFDEFTPDEKMEFLRLQVRCLTAPVGNSTSAVIRLAQGTVMQDVTISAASNDSGVITKKFVAGTPITLSVRTAAVGGTLPANCNVTGLYRMGAASINYY